MLPASLTATSKSTKSDSIVSSPTFVNDTVLGALFCSNNSSSIGANLVNLETMGVETLFNNGLLHKKKAHPA